MNMFFVVLFVVSLSNVAVMHAEKHVIDLVTVKTLKYTVSKNVESPKRHAAIHASSPATRLPPARKKRLVLSK